MNKQILNINLRKQKRILNIFVSLNILNFFSYTPNLMIFTYFFMSNLSDKFYFGYLYNVRNNKLTIFNNYDQSKLLLYIYCPYFYTYLIF